MLSKLNDISTGIQDMGEFSMLHARDFIIYLLITLLIAVLELAMFIVVGFGYLALGAILIIGPILITVRARAQARFSVLVVAQSTHQVQLLSGGGKHHSAGNLADHAFRPEYHIAFPRSHTQAGSPSA